MKLFGNLEVPFKSPVINAERRRELFLFQKQNKIRFKNLDLLNLAFCHRSYTNEYKAEIDNNERLEFLGDSVLGLVTADFLYHHLPDDAEGELARIKSIVVSEPYLADIARTISLDGLLLMGKGEDHSGGRQKDAILADAMEAVIGAFYLDNGMKPVVPFVVGLLKEKIDQVLKNQHEGKDYKTLLQEWVQKQYKSCPKYHLVKSDGPDHKRTFYMEVLVNGTAYGVGEGTNKKKAEQAAAEIACRELLPSS